MSQTTRSREVDMIMAFASLDNSFYSSKTKKPEDYFSEESFGTLGTLLFESLIPWTLN
jgi:hypothetical protein